MKVIRYIQLYAKAIYKKSREMSSIENFYSHVKFITYHKPEHNKTSLSNLLLSYLWGHG